MLDWTEPCEPGGEEWHRRLDVALADPSPRIWWWLSFADPSRPTGSHFLGLAIVSAPNIIFAADEARLWGCNPGGQVAAWELHSIPRPEFVYRLWTGDEARRIADLPPEGLFIPDT
jgi:hypothetical protein